MTANCRKTTGDQSIHLKSVHFDGGRLIGDKRPFTLESKIHNIHLSCLASSKFANTTQLKHQSLAQNHSQNRMENQMENLMDSVNCVSYPRTGKRGVPQQFPRRLYNMLESESQLQPSDKQCLIAWSSTGKAFRIEDVNLFSTLVLPKYFRTSKFSSFQRNLNLVSLYNQAFELV